jgi:hypothetical protein
MCVLFVAAFWDREIYYASQRAFPGTGGTLRAAGREMQDTIRYALTRGILIGSR